MDFRHNIRKGTCLIIASCMEISTYQVRKEAFRHSYCPNMVIKACSTMTYVKQDSSPPCAYSILRNMA